VVVVVDGDKGGIGDGGMGSAWLIGAVPYGARVDNAGAGLEGAAPKDARVDDAGAGAGAMGRRDREEGARAGNEPEEGGERVRDTGWGGPMITRCDVKLSMMSLKPSFRRELVSAGVTPPVWYCLRTLWTRF
jgi:hypothetical protein